MNLSIIIPIKINYNVNLFDFVKYINELSQQLEEYKYEIIIADESKDDVFNYIETKTQNLDKLKHLRPDSIYRTGNNDKLNGIFAALKYSEYDKILLVDDHYRVSKSTLINLVPLYDTYDCFKMMPKFQHFPVSVLIDLCGMYVVNLIDPKKQYCGHLCFKKTCIEKYGFPNRNSLFDELAIEMHIKKHRCTVGYIRNVSLEAVQNISMKKFWEQRVRYAYENMAFPTRFVFSLLILPGIFLLSILNFKIALLIILFLSIIITAVAGMGQLLYGKNISPWYTFLFAPMWFWFYPITSWIAVVKYFTGGVMFGGNKIKNALVK
jgi:cellulose synthase/poly-beta-1,6-N-acetylglucosamine synthase-like glycosyltransferase